MKSLAFVLILLLHYGQAIDPLLRKGLIDKGSTDKCFCQLEGKVDDCMCDVDTVDYFNNMKIFPRLQSLLQKDYFRYFKYNAHRPCPFWNADSGKCKFRSCGVEACTPDEIPPGLKAEPEVSGTCDDKPAPPENEEHNNQVDSTLSDDVRADLQSWKDYDDSQGTFCLIDPDENCPDCDYVDLTRNPERFTGYSGEAAHRIWRAIYEENCFNPARMTSKKNKFSAAFFPKALETMCLEKRAFYRAISGLHSSITVHLSSQHPDGTSDKKSNSLFPGIGNSEVYGPNLSLFLERFDPDMTGGLGPYWLKNLYFVYLLELRAITKAAPFLQSHSFYTGNQEEDKETQIAVKELLNLMRSFPDHFDESTMFKSGSKIEMLTLKQEFREHFHNISRVMDCVGCDKCKLWGKLQITGLGTALKILFSSDWADKETINMESLTDVNHPLQMYLNSSDLSTPVSDLLVLTRNEIVALMNAFGRLSTSIQQLERFRRMLDTS